MWEALKKDLLTISEMAKLADCSLKSLRYYERMGLLKPVQISEAGYRYYSAHQMNLIWLIRYCVELDIPLKMLHDFMNQEGHLDYEQVLAYGKQIAYEKIARIEEGIRFIESSEQELQLVKDHESNEKYTVDLKEKYFYLEPHDPTLGEAESIRTATRMQDEVRKHLKSDRFETQEWGVYYAFSEKEIKRYLFMELPYKVPEMKNVKVVPAGEYHCIQVMNEASQLERAPQLFPEIFEATKNVIAIERMLVSERFEVVSEQLELEQFRMEIRALGLP